MDSLILFVDPCMLYSNGLFNIPIEYGGKWKMLHYYAKNFFSPIVASGMVQEGELYVYVITDAQDLQDCTLRIDVRKWDTLDKPVYTFTTKPFNQVRKTEVILKIINTQFVAFLCEGHLLQLVCFKGSCSDW